MKPRSARRYQEMILHCLAQSNLPRWRRLSSRAGFQWLSTVHPCPLYMYPVSVSLFDIFFGRIVTCDQEFNETNHLLLVVTSEKEVVSLSGCFETTDKRFGAAAPAGKVRTGRISSLVPVCCSTSRGRSRLDPFQTADPFVGQSVAYRF